MATSLPLVFVEHGYLIKTSEVCYVQKKVVITDWASSSKRGRVLNHGDMPDIPWFMSCVQLDFAKNKKNKKQELEYCWVPLSHNCNIDKTKTEP